MRKLVLAWCVLSSHYAIAKCVVIVQDPVTDSVSEWHYAKESEAISFLRLAKKGQPGIATLVECAEKDFKKAPRKVIHHDT